MSEKTENSFLSRWSARKLKKTEKPAPETTNSEADISAEQVGDITPEPDNVASNPSPKPVWQDPELDIASRRQALRDIFKKPGIGLPDGLDEYERDYNYHNFAKLGDVVTHEMRRMLEQQINDVNPADPESADKTPEKPEPPNPEDNKLA